MLDKNLFIYLTKRSGHTLSDVAELWDVPLSGVYKRLNEEIELRRDQMESWMLMVGARDAGPVFFPVLVAYSQPDAPAAGGPDGC